MKKFLKIILITISIILILLLICFFTFDYIINYKISNFKTFKNDNNGYCVLIDEVGEAVLFGPSKIKVKLINEKGKKIDSFTDFIFNDGGSLADDNVSVNWKDSSVDVILSGEEQSDVTHTIYFGSEQKYE